MLRNPRANNSGGREAQLAAPHREDPVEHLHAGGYGDQERHQAEERQVDGTRREHVVGPHGEAECPDGRRREDECLVAEQRFPAEDRQDLADDAHRGQHHDVDRRVRVEPEDVLVEDRVAAVARVEERTAVIAVDEQHDQGARQHRGREQPEDRGHENGPDHDRHPEERHAGRAHLEDRHEEVDRPEDRARTDEDDGDDPQV
jgi:hypothetical protein